MDDWRHEIPTHLSVEDKAFYGLTARQVMLLIAGTSSGYGLWNQWPDLPMPLRIGLAASCVVLASAIAFVRPYGRGLEEWAFVALHYLTLPKTSVWRPREIDVNESNEAETTWAELTPRIRWEVTA
jgi:hypothetical protein